jgi:hypothetical protein
MKRWSSPVLALLGGLGSSAVACSAHHGAQAGQGTHDAGDDAGNPAQDDGGSDGAASGEASTPTQTYLRIANVSPDMPSIDICLAPHGTGSFQGPLIGHVVAAASGDGGEGAEAEADEGGAAAPGVAYPQVSAYLSLDPGQLDVRIVPAGAASCSPIPFLPDGTDLPSLALGAYSTLLVAGDLAPAGADPGVTVAVLPDDAVLAGGAASLRAINAMPGDPALDFGVGSADAPWLPLFTGVRFAAASAQVNPDDGILDSAGYASIAPFADEAMSARPSSSDAGTDVASASAVTIPLGSIATVIAIGGKTGDAAHPPGLLLCTDNAPSGGILADCSIVP